MTQGHVVRRTDRQSTPRSIARKSTPSWFLRRFLGPGYPSLLVISSSLLIIAWVVIVFLVSSARFVVFAPRAKTGFEVLVALLALFVALILVLFPAEHVRHRTSWLALGFLVLGAGGLFYGYLLPLLRGKDDLNTSMYATLGVRTTVTMFFAVGLALARPPRVPSYTFGLVTFILALGGVFLAFFADNLPVLTRLADLEAAAESSHTTMPGLTSWHWMLAAIPLGIALVAVYGATRHFAHEAFGVWLIVAMVLMAGSQLHSLFWPATYSPILTTASLLRLSFTAIVAIGAVVALKRISLEREHALATERAYGARLLEVGRLRANFTAMVAHELGNPLMAIDRSAELLAADPLTPLQERARATIIAEAALMNALVADVQTAVGADREDFTILPVPVGLDLLLADALAYARTLPGNHPIDSPVVSPVRVICDPERVAQVLRNLLSNAAKFSPPDCPIELRAMERDKHVRIEVADQGVGIHADDMKRVFERFGRGRNAEGTRVPGMGLGLYVSRQIVRAHGSDLTFESIPGKGTVFSFELEMAQ